MSRWTWITNVYLQPRKPTVPELRQKKCGQQVEQSGPASLLYTGDISPGVLCPHVESSVQKRHGHVGAHPEEGHKNDPRGGTPRWESWGYSFWRRLWEDLRVAFQYLKGGYKKEGDRLFSRVCCDRTRRNGLKSMSDFLSKHATKETWENFWALCRIVRRFSWHF